MMHDDTVVDVGHTVVRSTDGKVNFVYALYILRTFRMW